jgi:hypothetical protein
MGIYRRPSRGQSWHITLALVGRSPLIGNKISLPAHTLSVRPACHSMVVRFVTQGPRWSRFRAPRLTRPGQSGDGAAVRGAANPGSPVLAWAATTANPCNFSPLILGQSRHHSEQASVWVWPLAQRGCHTPTVIWRPSRKQAAKTHVSPSILIPPSLIWCAACIST